MRRSLMLALGAAILCASCGAFSGRDLALPPTPLLSGGQGWAIVTSSYVRLKEKPAAEASDLTALRDGTEVEILGREFDAAADSLWYRVRATDEAPVGGKAAAATALEGWVGASDLAVYSTRAEADRALRGKKKP